MGTAISTRLSGDIENISLFARDKKIVKSINEKHRNLKYFPNIELSRNINAYSIKELNNHSDFDLAIIALPSNAVRDVITDYREIFKNKLIISVSKGIEYPSLKTMTEVISEIQKGAKLVSFSGPNFADELAHGYLAAATIGSDDFNKFLQIKSYFQKFLFDYSYDIHAVEICGILKNVYSIGMGIWDSKSSSNNEHYAFLSLCFKEMQKFLEFCSSDMDISSKFCCFGDFNLTANIDKSRNRTLGLMIGKGFIKSSNNIQNSIIIEGMKSIKGIIQLASNNAIEMPIAEEIARALEGYDFNYLRFFYN